MKNIVCFLLFYSTFSPCWADPVLGSQAYENTKKILGYGARTIGSSGHRKVEQFLINTLQNMHWNVERKVSYVQTPIGKKPIINLIAQNSKKDSISKEVVLLAHYDSKRFQNFDFVGADDSASAVGLLLAIAMNAKKLEHIPLSLVFLDGEEAINQWTEDDSLYGSRILSQEWLQKGEKSRISAMILLDMIGGRHTSFCKEQNSDREITEKIWSIAKQKGADTIFMDCQSNVGDDHIPFVQKGFPIVDIIAYPFPLYWHTKEDTLENISSKKLQTVGEILLQFLKEESQQEKLSKK